MQAVLGEAFVDGVDAAGGGDAILDDLDDLADEPGKLKDCELVAVADVEGRVHERNKTVNEVVRVLERVRLRAVRCGRCLHDELDVGYDTAVIRVH